MPLIPALGRQRQVNLCGFEASLVYRMISRTGRTVTRKNPLSKTKQTEKDTNTIERRELRDLRLLLYESGVD